MANVIRTWSPQQQRIFDWAANEHGSAVVIAVAGAGKTTTIVELANRINPRAFSSFVAFNKSVAEELKTRLPKHVKAMTLNGMGFSAWARHVGQGGPKLEVSANKTRDIMRRLLSEEQIERHGAAIPKLVALAKGSGIVPKSAGIFDADKYVGLTRDTDEVWQSLIDHYSVDTDDNVLEAIDLARYILRETINIGRELVDFDDQLYLPIIHRARFFQNDWLMVDEAQDVNKIQRAMLKRALRVGGRLVAVGDPAQAIYGFRGADTSSIDNIKKEFGAVELPLTVSYRCPQAVVREAQRFVQHIQATPTAPEGSVQYTGKYGHGLFQSTDAILCRNTSPIVDMAFKLLRNHVPCRVLGKEIGVGLIALIKKMRAKTLENLSDKLGVYQERETAKFMVKGEEQKAEALADRITTLHVFINNLDENNRTVPALVTKIESIFTDTGRGILTLCTVHKAKGLEWPRVFILDAADLMPSKWARQEWQQEQERNLQYVAVTRAQAELHYIDTKGMAA